MMSWFRHWSIRARIVLLMLTVLLPVAAMLAWLLATDLKLAREAGYARVTILRDHAAADVDRRLTRTRAILARLADRPLVKSLDPERCDPAIGAITRLQPEFGALTVSDLRGRALCTTEGDAVRPPTSTLQGAPWFEEAVRSGAFHAGDATIQPLTGRWVTMLTQPIRSPSGAIVGMLALPVDLLTLNEQLLASTPASAVVTVLDRRHAVLLHSADPAAFIGTAPSPVRPTRRKTGAKGCSRRPGATACPGCSRSAPCRAPAGGSPPACPRPRCSRISVPRGAGPPASAPACC